MPASLWVPQGQGGEQGGGSPFDMFFGGGQRKDTGRGKNMDIELPVTLEDLYARTHGLRLITLDYA